MLPNAAEIPWRMGASSARTHYNARQDYDLELEKPEQLIKWRHTEPTTQMEVI